MKALQITEVGKPVEVKEIDTPKPEKGEALLKIEAAALNHRDIYITQGLYPNITTPCTLGSDGVGTVEEVGPEVDPNLKGKEMVVNPGIAWGNDERHQSKDFRVLGMPDPGTFAEYFKIPVEYLYEKPEHLDTVHAAALPLAGLTAYRSLFVRGDLQRGESVLITGIGGGVAQMAMQFAVGFGSEVHVTSGNDEKVRKAMEYGAKGGVNYKEEGWSKALKEKCGGFDVIIDSAGGEGFNHLIRLARPGGRIVFYGGTKGKVPELSPQPVFWKQLSLLGSTMGSDKNFNDMISFTRDLKIEPAVDRVMKFEEGPDAFEYLDQGEQFGKVVIKP